MIYQTLIFLLISSHAWSKDFASECTVPEADPLNGCFTFKQCCYSKCTNYQTTYNTVANIKCLVDDPITGRWNLDSLKCDCGSDNTNKKSLKDDVIRALPRPEMQICSSFSNQCSMLCNDLKYRSVQFQGGELTLSCSIKYKQFVDTTCLCSGSSAITYLSGILALTLTCLLIL